MKKTLTHARTRGYNYNVTCEYFKNLFIAVYIVDFYSTVAAKRCCWWWPLRCALATEAQMELAVMPIGLMHHFLVMSSQLTTPWITQQGP